MTQELNELASLHGLPATYLEALQEVEDWRTGCQAGFGITTANPHKTLVTLAQKLEAHHQEHHTREKQMQAVILAARGVIKKHRISLSHGAGTKEMIALEKAVRDLPESSDE